MYKLISFHCILHHQNLCAKSAVLQDTINKCIAIVNYIRGNAMRHRIFRHLLALDEETYSIDLPYYCKVRWLSTGQILKKVLSLKSNILNFYINQGTFCYLSDDNFCRNVAFLSDIMTLQNNLNVCLQGKTKHIYEMWQKIQGFRKKLILLTRMLSDSNINAEHFPELTNLLKEKKQDNKNFEEYVDVLKILINEYTERFSDFDERILEMQLVYEPHLVDVYEAPPELQNELIEFGENNIIKSHFNDKKDPIEIWKNAIEYPLLQENARRILSCFGSTYCCESTFSLMSKIKTNLRTQITDIHLEDQLRLRVAQIEPDFKLLSSKKPTQRSN